MTALSQETLLALLRYEPETGKLFWRERTPDMFTDGKYPRERSCATWNGKHAGKEALFTVRKDGHKAGIIFRRKYQAHRVIWCMVHGYWPNVIDHENQDPSDNRIRNLRDVDHMTNGQNMRLSIRNTSGRLGVCWDRQYGKWRAKIQHSGKTIYLGLFTDFADAVAAREAADKKYGFHKNHGRAA